MTTLRDRAFRILPLMYQLIGERPWTTAQADEAERLVREIAAASIVARNAVAAQEVGAPAAEDGLAAVSHAEEGRGALAGSVGAAAGMDENWADEP